jgi:NAD(P)-dependent dehydrogenase (short-subunit alcohol dehydrogenase family)
LLAARGARVQLTGRDQDRGSDLNAELRRAGGDTDFVAADLRESGACDRVVEHTLTRFGRIDVLVNSAGIYVAATTPETTDEMWNETLDTNLGAVF